VVNASNNTERHARIPNQPRLFDFCGTTPFNNGGGLFCFKTPLLAGSKPVAREHFLRASRWHFWKYRSSTW